MIVNKYLVLLLIIIFLSSTISKAFNSTINDENIFCLYSENKIIKTVNPFYLDSTNKTIYFDRIEDYARYIGPMWIGVSNCKNDILVNSVGEYYKIKPSKKRSISNKNDNNETNYNTNSQMEKNDIDDNIVKLSNTTNADDDNILKNRTITDYKKYYDNIYKKFMKNGLKCLALTSKNPAYNPYHPALIQVSNKNDKPANIIQVMGISYDENYQKYLKILKEANENKSTKDKYVECGTVRNMSPGSSVTCTVTYSTDIQDSISITDSNGNSYRKSYGKVTSNGDTYTDEINNQIELTTSISNSVSNSGTDSNGTSNAYERVYTIIDGQSNSKTNNYEVTHTDTSEKTFTHTESEEHTHTTTKGGEHVEEHNWSDSDETSHTEEYSRMNEEAYNEHKNEFIDLNDKDYKVSDPNERLKGKQKRKVGATVAKSSGRSAFAQSAGESAVGALGACGTGALIGTMLAPGVGTAAGCVIGGILGAAAGAWDGYNQYKQTEIAEEANEIAKKANEHAKEANDIAKATYLQETEISNRDASLQIALSNADFNNQKVMAIIGTRSTSDTTSHTHTTGGSISDSTNWSDSQADTSGFSNAWGTSNGYSDAYSRGYSETSSTEHSESDSISKMITKNFNRETGWINQNTTTDTTSNGYTFGSSSQKSYSTNLSYDEALDISAQYALQRSYTLSQGKIESRQVTFVIPDGLCYNLSVLPMFEVEIIIQACGNYNEETGYTYITYERVIRPIKFLGFSEIPISCNQNNDDVDIINNDSENFDYIKISSDDTIDTLRSGSYLSPGNIIVSKNKKFSFGILNTGELILCEGPNISSKCTYHWRNEMNYIPDTINGINVSHDFKFHVGDNGHLYVTAKNIYGKYHTKVEYPEEYNTYLNKENLSKSDNNTSPKLEKRIVIRKNTTTTTTTSNINKATTTVTKTATTTTSNINKATTTVTKTATTTTSNINKATTTVTKTNSNINKETTTVTKTNSNINKETTTATITNSIPSPAIDEDYITYGNSTTEYVIWDSLPKDLPFNVGFPGATGYYLHLKEESVFNGASLTLYDGTGVIIWQIKSNDKYKGYAFPREYNMPLAFETKISEEVALYDKHNWINFKVKDTFKHSIELNCSNIMNENEALVSNNGKYRFYLQETGNIVVKENSRTAWSSSTANISIYEAPYRITFSPLGELILRDKNNYIVWQILNPLSINNYSDIPNNKKFKLIMSDEGELYIEDEKKLMYWSNWHDVRLYTDHVRYIEPVMYEVSSCNEHLRVKNTYNLFSKPDIYNFNQIKNDSKTYNNFYFNNLLPGESLISIFDARLNVTDTDVIFYYYTDKYDKKNTDNKVSKNIGSCTKNSGIKELKLELDGLFLYCNDKTKITIVKIPNIYNNSKNFNRLSIEYRYGMEYPDLMIFNTITWEPLWGLNPVRYLHSLKEVKKIRKDEYNRISEDKYFTPFDRLISIDGSGEFIYLSNRNGLEFKHGSSPLIRSIAIENNNLYIDNKMVINNNKDLEIIYDSTFDKLVANNNTHENIWEAYGEKKCDKLISNDSNCNTLFSYSKLNTLNNQWFILFDNNLYYNNINLNNTQEVFDINNYMKTTYKLFNNEPVYSLSLNEKGDIVLNDNKYILHKEYFTSDDYYYLYAHSDNVILRSSTGEYKWALNKIISNRPYDANEIKIGESFKEGEMIYCGDYSMIILNGKLLYRDHKSKTSTEIKYSPNKSGYLYEIEIGINDINFKDKENNSLNHISSSNQSFNSKLYCDKNTRSIVWKISNTIKWRYPEINSNNGDLQDKKYILLCSKYYNKCLYAANRIGSNVRYADYSKTLKNFKWYFEIINKKSYLKSAINDDICLIVDNDKLITGKCSENMDKARISYNEPKNYIEYFNSSNKQYKCISGIDDRNNRNSRQYLTLANCNKKDEKMIWEIKTPN